MEWEQHSHIAIPISEYVSQFLDDDKYVHTGHFMNSLLEGYNKLHKT